jgi:metal-responsive CopG/Arc/MetJ family transcriptional regulator
MKAIQVMFDEKLLARLDATEEVRREGRSAVLRRAAEGFLRSRVQREITDGYRRAYADTTALDKELAGWEDEGVWPET